MNYKNRKVDAEQIFSFVECTLRCLENEENEEHETNQCLIGMKESFRGHVVKAWKGVDFSTIKHKEVRKIVVVKCAEHYVKCWKQRNECVHDEDKQQKRVTDGYENVKSRI